MKKSGRHPAVTKVSPSARTPAPDFCRLFMACLGALGVLIGSAGPDPMTAEARFTFGSLQLTAGTSHVAAATAPARDWSRRSPGSREPRSR